ncbi:unnamed protein product [Adineta ricciae]|uniref:Protein zer-1 homolog-like C-terminal domain-containing protein n=1 Tax=Adineta ricciae TaxID=249248 RepID=A0A815VFL3_ADIRI|nr:unnamed protein product [Adineta ricciae]
MVDNPDKLNVICLQKFVSLLKSDQLIWKKQLEEDIENIQHNQNRYSRQLLNYHQPHFLQYFRHGFGPLNSMLSDHLINYLATNDHLNDYTLSLFSSNITCLRRIAINVKYLSRLQCHIFNQHPHLIQLDITFQDHNSIRTNPKAIELFYQHVCPSIDSSFDKIFNVYSPMILHHKYSSLQHESRRASTSSNSPSIYTLWSSEEFSHHKILNEILSNIHPMTIERLKSLSLSHYKFFTSSNTTPARQYSAADMSPIAKFSTRYASSMTTPVNSIPTNLLLLLKFNNLTALNISSTDLRTPCFDIIINTLDKLDTLDLSSCRSIKLFNSLLRLSSKLKWLNLSNCSFNFQQNPTIYHILYELKSLEYLDLSNDIPVNESNIHPIIDLNSDLNRFLSDTHCLPRLKHFDISGLKTVSSISLNKFLLNHSNLQFLGLFLTNEKYSPCVFDSNDLCYSKYRHYTYDIQHIAQIALTENDLVLYEPYLIEALKRYQHRHVFVQKILSYFFFLTRSFQSKQAHLLIELIHHIMSLHTNIQSIQMASTACLYNLTRTPIIEQIHVKHLAQIVNATMDVMETFPTHQQLQKNCILILCSDRILHEAHFKFHLLATLVMQNLHNYTDLAIIQTGVAILSLLTTRLTIDECTHLGSVTNLKRLLQVIEQQIDRLQTMQITENQQANVPHNEQTINDIDMLLNNPPQLASDDTLRFCLSLLWNLTDENAVVCENFIQSMGLELFQRLLHLFTSDTIVLTKIVGLLSNIAEVPHLKTCLYSIGIVSSIQKYINEAVLDVAFSATGIFAHLLYDQKDDEIDFDLCKQMMNAIRSWQNPHTNMVTYRSFKPFLPLLYCTHIPVVQLWAIWAMHHVCSTDRNRYVRMIHEENILEIIHALYDDQLSNDDPDTFLLELLQSILHLVKRYDSNHRHKSSAVAS